MKKTFILAAIALSVAGCNSDIAPSKRPHGAAMEQPEPFAFYNVAEDLRNLNAALEPFKTAAQHFTVTSAAFDAVVGSAGTTIRFEPGVFETVDGSPLGPTIDVELIELKDQHDFMCNSAATVSDGELLVSGGSYYINCVSNGKQLKLRQGKQLLVSFPKRAQEDMQLFYGQRDRLGMMNWRTNDVPFDPTIDSTVECFMKLIEHDTISGKLPKKKNDDMGWCGKVSNIRYYTIGGKYYDTIWEEKVHYHSAGLERAFYAQTGIDRLGWINCDRFYEAEERTQLAVELPEVNKRVLVKTYVLFEGINSVLEQQMVAGGEQKTQMVRNLPKGQNVRVVAFYYNAGKMYAFESKSLQLNDAPGVALKMKEVSVKEMQNILGVKQAG